MKIFVIGPEGAGKTVFVAMLSRFMATHSGELVFDPDDYGSTRYVADALELLECRRWPKGNPEGQIRILSWDFGRKGGKLHKVSLFDYSGQDMRSALLEEDVEKLVGHPKELRLKVDDSDVLIYLLDMDGFIGGGTLGEQNENAWLLQSFLKRPQWRKKRRILVLSKSDLYTAMLSEAGGDPKEVIAQHWPKVYSPAVFHRERNEIECYPIASVRVETKFGEDAIPIRIPAIPLSSEGFEALVEAILTRIERDRFRRTMRKGGKLLGNALSVTGELVRRGLKVAKGWKSRLLILTLLLAGGRSSVCVKGEAALRASKWNVPPRWEGSFAAGGVGVFPVGGLGSNLTPPGADRWTPTPGVVTRQCSRLS